MLFFNKDLFSFDLAKKQGRYKNWEKFIPLLEECGMRHCPLHFILWNAFKYVGADELI